MSPAAPRATLALAALLAALQLGGCAGAQRRPPGPEEAAGAAVEFPPEEPRLAAAERELEGKNDEELLAIATAAGAAGDWTRAAAAFARLADVHPGSRHRAAAQLGAGLAFARLEEWRLALERFRAVEREGSAADAVEAAFRIAECQYHLRELGDARATLDALARRADVGAGDRVRALSQRGIVELEEGRPDDAERSLRLALATFEAAGAAERLDEEPAARAQFYLGEVYGGWFRALPVDPADADAEALRRALERKAELLLSAQGHYLRTIRMGNDRWAVASGVRIAELYDGLRSQLLDAPLPPGLDEAQARAYREEVRREVRVLAAKAIAAYEQTLARAARTGVDDLGILPDAQRALERLRAALAEDASPRS